nr:ABC transporter ATP-binding protein [uncultured Lichenicoccus sp.]
MARIQLRDIAHSYRPDPNRPEDYALRPLDLVWEDGGAYALLGPSGSGKSTLLNILSGLVRPSSGQLLFDGVEVTDRNTRERNIAQVFQFPVIYDTMTVFGNLAFPLRNRGVPRGVIRERVEKVAAILDLSNELGRRASGLTADAKQRISMGRGLVRTDVAAILFDEPLTVIDPALKWQLRRKLKQIHNELKVTLIYVTHDQTEALTFADHVVVMENGEVLQQGSPQELFEHPAHVFVGDFIGSPGMNLLPCILQDHVALVGGQPVTLSAHALDAHPNGALILGIRPEFIELADPGEAAQVTVTVTDIEPLGGHQLIRGRLGEHEIAIKALPEILVQIGETLPVWLPHAWIRLYSDGRLVN